VGYLCVVLVLEEGGREMKYLTVTLAVLALAATASAESFWQFNTAPGIMVDSGTWGNTTMAIVNGAPTLVAGVTGAAGDYAWQLDVRTTVPTGNDSIGTSYLGPSAASPMDYKVDGLVIEMDYKLPTTQQDGGLQYPLAAGRVSWSIFFWGPWPPPGQPKIATDIRFEWYMTGGATNIPINPGYSLSDGQWHHVAVQMDPVAKMQYIQAEGLSASCAMAGGNWLGYTSQMYIPVDTPATNGWGLDGTVDNIYVDVIPEPATVGLLALGGLALLRRRK
jgi:hypothetical protein